MRHVPHVYLPPTWSSGQIVLPEATDRHLAKVLRRTAGEPVSYTDGAGTIGRGTYVPGAVRRGAEERVPAPFPEIVLSVAPPRSVDRLRFLVEKAAELGVAEVRWLRTARTEGHIPRADKLSAWAIAALEQSRGAWVMRVADAFSTIADAVAEAHPNTVVLIAHSGGSPIRAALDGTVGIERVVIAVGPEGGFADDELASGIVRIGLGDLVLRVETAAIAAAAAVRFG